MATGSLQIKDGAYYVVVRLPDETGRKKTKWIHTGVKVAGNNKRLANEKKLEILVKIEQQKIIYSEDILFIDWIDKWMEQKKNEVRIITFEGYMSYLESHIIPFFKPLRLKLKDVSSMHIQDFINKKKNAGLTTSSIKKYMVVLRGALQEAVRKRIIPYNPASLDYVSLPKSKKFVGKAYSVKQAEKLLEVIKNEPLRPAIILGLLYGLRRSEVAGLRWQDINFDKGTIHICNTVVKFKTEIEAEQTKSEASNRTLIIINGTKEYLKSIKRHQSENRLLMGNSYQVNDYVCTWADGRPFKPDCITSQFAKILKNNSLPHIRFHDLRHTAGSLLLEKGLTYKQVQEYLGHERPSTTLDIYSHLSADGKKEAANVMGNLLTIQSY